MCWVLIWLVPKIHYRTSIVLGVSLICDARHQTICSSDPLHPATGVSFEQVGVGEGNDVFRMMQNENWWMLQLVCNIYMLYE